MIGWFLVIMFVGASAVVISILRSPEGWEDQYGFHRGKPKR